MSYFAVSPEDASALASAWAEASGAPRTACDLLGQAAHDEAVGMPRSAATLRELAQVRQTRGSDS